MKKFSQIITLCVFLLFVFVQTAVAAFNDVPPQDDHYLAITYLQENGIVTGYEKGTLFKPDELLTRAQALRILIGSSPLRDQLPAAEASISKGASIPLHDVQPSDWVAPYVIVGTKNGVIQGTADGKLEGSRNVTTAEFIKMLLELNKFDLTPWEDQELFVDVPDDWSKPYMNYAGKAGIVQPSSDNKVYPSQILRRRDVAQMMYVMALIMRDKDKPFLLDQAQRQLDQVKVYVDDKNLVSAQHASRLAVDITQQLYKYFPDDAEVVGKAKVARAYDFLINSMMASQLGNDSEAADWLEYALIKASEAVNVDAESEPNVEELRQMIDQQLAL